MQIEEKVFQHLRIQDDMILLSTAVNLHVSRQLQRPDVRKSDVDPVMEGLSEALPASRSVHRTG